MRGVKPTFRKPPRTSGLLGRDNMAAFSKLLEEWGIEEILGNLGVALSAYNEDEGEDPEYVGSSHEERTIQLLKALGRAEEQARVWEQGPGDTSQGRPWRTPRTNRRR